MVWIELSSQGLIIAERIIVVGQAETAPMKRLLTAIPPDKIIILTGGQRRQSVAILDSGHAVITALTVSEIMIKLHQLNKDGEENLPTIQKIKRGGYESS